MEQRKRKIKQCIIITKKSSLIRLFFNRTQKGWVLKHRQSTIKYDTKMLFKQTGNLHKYCIRKQRDCLRKVQIAIKIKADAIIYSFN